MRLLPIQYKHAYNNEKVVVKALIKSITTLYIIIKDLSNFDAQL